MRILINIMLLLTLGALQATEPPAATQSRTQFINYELWPDNNGDHIDAHGGGMMFHNGTYYWFGQHMVASYAGNWAQVSDQLAIHVGPECFRCIEVIIGAENCNK